MAFERNRSRKDVRLADRSNNAVSKPFRHTGLGKLPPEIREIIFINLLATPPPYAGHEFAINSAGPKKTPSRRKKFVHITASWHQVTQTCRQIYLESHPLFFASESYYLTNTQELTRLLDYGCSTSSREWECVLDYGCRHSLNPPFRHVTITTLCLGGLVTDQSLYTKEKIDQILSDPTDHRSTTSTRQQLEAQTFMSLDTEACHRLSKLSNLKTVGLRMRVGQEMEYVNFMYGVSAMRRGLVEFVDQSHWLIRTQHPNDVWRIQYSCFTCADYAQDKNTERISYDRRRIELEVTDIDSRAPGLKEGDERYVEVQIQRIKNDDDMETVSEVSDTDVEDLHDRAANLFLGSPDLSATQVGELLDIPGPAPDEVEIDLNVPPLEMEDDDLQISPLHNNLSGTELEQETLSTLEVLFGRPQSQDDYNLLSSGQPDQENDHALSGTASQDVSVSQSKEQSDQQAEKSLLPTNSPFVWHPVPKHFDHALSGTASQDVSVSQSKEQSDQQAGKSLLPTNSPFPWHPAPTYTESSRKFQTDSDDEGSHSQTESTFGEEVLQSTTGIKAQEERRRTVRKRLLRQLEQPLNFSDIPRRHTEEEMELFYGLQELADLGINEQTETGVQKSIQSSSISSEFREHDIENPGVTSQPASTIEKQPLMAFLIRFWSLPTCGAVFTILLAFGYSCLFLIFLTASSTAYVWNWKRSHEE